MEKVSKKVISGEVKQKPETPGKKSILSLFVKEDIASVTDYIITERFVPGIIDAFINAIALTLTGETVRTGYSSNRRTTSRREPDRASYSDYYDDRRRDHEPARTAVNLRDLNVNDIGLASEDDADKVMDYLVEQLDRYNRVMVADVYDAVGITVDYTDRSRSWGWRSATGFRKPYQGRDGCWYLDLPRPERL